MHPFNDKVAVVTGASSGIGKALAQAFAKYGCHVAIADIRPQELEETRASLEPYGKTYKAYALDVSNKDAIYAFADQVAADFPSVDIVINNAGVSLTTPMAQASMDDFHWLMDINFWGMVYGCQAFLPHLLKQKEAWLSNVSSIFGIIGVPTQGTYCASKFAIRGYTESLRQEYKRSKLKVSAIHPGGVKTNIVRWGKIESSYADEDRQKTMISSFDKVAKTTPEKAAEIIIKGMSKGKKRILVGGDAWFLDKISRLFPQGYDAIVGRQFQKVDTFQAGI
ncbi:MAG: SDR family NAD(P)-dependent oxidoreductase [Bacteroidota bacterium]